jgi:hypothetical protein
MEYWNDGILGNWELRNLYTYVLRNSISILKSKFVSCNKKDNMNTIELKQSFHQLIDSIDNKNLLINFYDLIKKRSTAKEGQLWNKLSKQEQQELILSLDESKNPENLIDHEEMKKMNNRQSPKKKRF